MEPLLVLKVELVVGKSIVTNGAWLSAGDGWLQNMPKTYDGLISAYYGCVKGRGLLLREQFQ